MKHSIHGINTAFCLALFSATTCFLTACTELNPQNSSQTQAASRALQNPQSLYQTVLQEATELQGTLVDGWFCGEDSRSLKTGYSKTTPETKARFACDYQQMLSQKGQDMTNKFESYVPYSERSRFARKWWSDSKYSADFLKDGRWKQIQWLHESLRDGSELWWRALEKQYPSGIDSMAALAHDKEQDMVTKFQENEKSPPRSFSALDKDKD